jgi:hypothetical protein
MWGSPSPETGRLQPVSGYYRLTRGSFAQLGLPVPYPERVVDTVLDHSRDPRHFGADRENACNVLDVAHPLWLCARQIPHRSAEVRNWAARQLAAVLPRWRDGRGFAFGPGGEPGLQGTETWPAIVWLLCDLTGQSQPLGYRPRGVHRPNPPPAHVVRADTVVPGSTGEPERTVASKARKVKSGLRRGRLPAGEGQGGRLRPPWPSWRTCPRTPARTAA